MGEIELLAYIIKWRDEFSADIRVLKIDADIFVRPHAIRILLSLLLREGYLKNSSFLTVFNITSANCFIAPAKQ